MPSDVLTTKNKRAMDLYLSPDERYQGNGTACWMAVYRTRNRETAAANWARMLGNARARAHLQRRQQALEDRRADEIAYSQAEALRDLLKVQRDAMQTVSQGKVARRTKYTDPDTGAAHEAVAYADVEGMRNPAEAIKATVEAIRIQGKHPDQQVQGTGVQVSISITTEWDGSKNLEVVNPGDHAEPPESAGQPPPVVVVERN